MYFFNILNRLSFWFLNEEYDGYKIATIVELQSPGDRRSLKLHAKPWTSAEFQNMSLFGNRFLIDSTYSDGCYS